MTDYVSVSIPESLAQRARLLAQIQNQPLDAVVAEVLDEALPSEGLLEAGNDVDAAVMREMIAYTELHSTLMHSHYGEYVAIFEGRLVDHDSDSAALYRRIIAQYPDQFVWLSRVEDEPLQTLHSYSPRLVPSS